MDVCVQRGNLIASAPVTISTTPQVKQEAAPMGKRHQHGVQVKTGISKGAKYVLT
jgi:hypothetical protein